MQVIEVKDSNSRKLFLDITDVIYENDPNWIRPLDQSIEQVFDENLNPYFGHGICTRWILFDASKQPIGRIAAFVNHKKANSFDVPTGGCGFFECIDDQGAANFLFDTAKHWLEEKGMSAMQGPINFGENDSFWGLLVEGFTPASYGMNYNPSYYKELFENYGFTTAYEQITNHLDLNTPFPERFTKIANWVASRPGYTFEHFDKSQSEKYVNHLMEIYNDGWQNFDNFSPIKKDVLLESFKKMEPIMDEKLIWFAYHNGAPAAFVVIIPDANQFIKGLNGKLNLIGKLKFAYNRWKGADRLRAVVMGTKQAYQKHGLESALFIKLKHYVIPKKQYNELELSWVGDFNDKMLSIHEATGAAFGKRHLTLVKTF